MMDFEGEGQQSAPSTEGHYANYFKIGHNAFEFLLDFGQFYTEQDRVQFHTRIITGPRYAKALMQTLEESVGRYEEKFGAILDE